MRFQNELLAKSVLLVVNLVVFLGTLFGVVTLHDRFIENNQAYFDFLYHNIPIYHTIYFFIIFLTFALIFYYKKRFLKESESFSKMIRFQKLRLSHVGLLLALGVSSWLFSIGLLYIEFFSTTFPGIQEMIDYFMRAEWFITVLVCGGILLPTLEELLFRGILFNMIRNYLPLFFALLLQALLYAYFQPNLIFSLISLFSGFIYCVLYYRLNSIFAPILVQITAMSAIYLTEGSAMRSFFLSLGQPALYVIMTVSMLFLLGGTLYVWKRCAPSSKSEYREVSG